MLLMDRCPAYRKLSLDDKTANFVNRV